MSVTGDYSLDRNRLVYHRGRVIYALEKCSRDYRHALDVPNGARCGCVCDECESNLIAKANLPDETYLREAHFAHEAGSHCQPTGERGLMEAFKLAFRTEGSVTLPVVECSPSQGEVIQFAPATRVAIATIRDTPGWSARHPDIVLDVGAVEVRITISVRSGPKEEHRQLAEKDGINLLWIRMQPDQEGKIYLGDVLDEIRTPAVAQWVHNVAGATHERVLRSELLARKEDMARRQREMQEEYRRRSVPSVVSRNQTTGTFWCSACNWKNSRFIPDAPGSKFGRCAHCGAAASPTQLRE